MNTRRVSGMVIECDPKFRPTAGIVVTEYVAGLRGHNSTGGLQSGFTMWRSAVTRGGMRAGLQIGLMTDCARGDRGVCLSATSVPEPLRAMSIPSETRSA